MQQGTIGWLLTPLTMEGQHLFPYQSHDRDTLLNVNSEARCTQVTEQHIKILKRHQGGMRGMHNPSKVQVVGKHNNVITNPFHGVIGQETMQEVVHTNRPEKGCIPIPREARILPTRSLCGMQ